jgi:hypothetical protein
MASTTVPIDKASVKQLRAFAQNHLGMDPHPSSNRETVLALIKAAWDKPDIILPNEDAPEAVQPAEKVVAPAVVAQAEKNKVEKTVTVFINVTEESGGSDPIPVGVNGRIMLIERGKNQVIPESYFEVLMHAVEHRYEPMQDGRGMNPIPKQVPKFPLQRVA